MFRLHRGRQQRKSLCPAHSRVHPRLSNYNPFMGRLSCRYGHIASVEPCALQYLVTGNCALYVVLKQSFTTRISAPERRRKAAASNVRSPVLRVKPLVSIIIPESIASASNL